MTPPRGADARTTPPAWRPVVVAGLAALAVYVLACFQLALAGFGTVEKIAIVEASKDLLWLGRWRMFTDLRTTHADLRLEVDGREVDVASLYPSRWDEGPGYTRDDFLDDRPRVAAMARDVCARTGARGVRLTRVTWTKTPGSREQPRHDERVDVLFEGTCG
ncbi:MAG: hypothetical protein ACOZNI_33440 [Myxococcota bacterium]